MSSQESKREGNTQPASHPWAVVAVELLNVVFYFSGFIALAVFLSRLLFCRGAVCGAARADTVFGAFSFVLWGVTAGLMAKDMAKGGFSGLPRFRKQPAIHLQNQQMKEAAMAA